MPPILFDGSKDRVSITRLDGSIHTYACGDHVRFGRTLEHIGVIRGFRFSGEHARESGGIFVFRWRPETREYGSQYEICTTDCERELLTKVELK